VCQVAHVGATIDFGHRDAQHTNLAHLAPQVHGELIGAVNFGGTGCNFSLRKIAHSVAQRINVFTQLEIQAGHVHGVFSEKLTQ
jgi:hypothetical protein